MKLIYRQHAIKRMFERAVLEADLLTALSNGKVVADYPDDSPYPSALLLGYTDSGRALHIVYADNPTENERIIITVYEPDPAIWNSDLITRRRT